MKKKPKAPGTKLQAPSSNPTTIPVQEAIAECNRLHELIERTSSVAAKLTTVSTHLAVMMGLQLRALKEAAPHGSWKELFLTKGKSVTRDTFGFSYETGRRYIRAAEGALERPGLSAKHRNLLLSIGDSAGSGATDAISSEDVTAISLTPEVSTALESATRGQTLRQLYIDLGIIKGDATERKRDDGDGEEGEDQEPEDLAPPTPEEMWELLYVSGIRDVEKFFLEKKHTVLSKHRAKELEENLKDWLKDLRSLKWD